MIRPYELRPDERVLGASRLFSGVDFVIVSKSDTVWNRRPGEVGLSFLMPMVYTSKTSIESPSARVTTARLVSLRLPMV